MILTVNEHAAPSRFQRQRRDREGRQGDAIMTRKQHTLVYRVIGRNVYRTTGVDHGNGGEDLQFVRQFASHEAALNWLWDNHPVQR